MLEAVLHALLPTWLGKNVETLHAGARPWAVAVLEAPWGLEPDELGMIEAALTMAGDERLRRLALAALRGQASAPG